MLIVVAGVMRVRQEEDALLSEMDVTGQAFEDMQEQNIRLMQQLREKDDANFKLMSERIKSNQIHKLLKEEKEELADQLLTLKTQVSEPESSGGCRTEGSLMSLAECEQTARLKLEFSVLSLWPLCDSGGCPAAGCEEAGGERAPPAGHH